MFRKRENGLNPDQGVNESFCTKDSQDTVLFISGIRNRKFIIIKVTNTNILGN